MAIYTSVNKIVAWAQEHKFEVQEYHQHRKFRSKGYYYCDRHEKNATCITVDLGINYHKTPKKYFLSTVLC